MKPTVSSEALRTESAIDTSIMILNNTVHTSTVHINIVQHSTVQYSLVHTVSVLSVTAY